MKTCVAVLALGNILYLHVIGAVWRFSCERCLVLPERGRERNVGCGESFSREKFISGLAHKGRGEEGIGGGGES